MEIQDKTNTNLVNLRKTIYLTIKSSLNFEECCHKLMLIQLEEGQQVCIHFYDSHSCILFWNDDADTLFKQF